MTERIDLLEASLENKLIEKLDAVIENKVAKEVSKTKELLDESIMNLRQEVDNLQAKVSESGNTDSLPQCSHQSRTVSIVIWNLAKQLEEDNDPTLLVDAANGFIRATALDTAYVEFPSIVDRKMDAGLSKLRMKPVSLKFRLRKSACKSYWNLELQNTWKVVCASEKA